MAKGKKGLSSKGERTKPSEKKRSSEGKAKEETPIERLYRIRKEKGRIPHHPVIRKKFGFDK